MAYKAHVRITLPGLDLATYKEIVNTHIPQPELTGDWKCDQNIRKWHGELAVDGAPSYVTSHGEVATNCVFDIYDVEFGLTPTVEPGNCRNEVWIEDGVRNLLFDLTKKQIAFNCVSVVSNRMTFFCDVLKVKCGKLVAEDPLRMTGWTPEIGQFI